MSPTAALTNALVLALTAPDQARADRAIALAESIGAGCTAQTNRYSQARGGQTRTSMTTRKINSALRRVGLDIEIVNNRDGYSYFCSTITGGQVGESVMVCYLNQQTVEQWVSDGRHAIWQEASA